LYVSIRPERIVDFVSWFPECHRTTREAVSSSDSTQCEGILKKRVIVDGEKCNRWASLKASTPGAEKSLDKLSMAI
jgi:hypothetical protein